jgi:hypothetical protein
MIDFMNTDKAKGIIDQYLTKGVYTAPPDINPVYDVREPGQEFPPLNPPINVTPEIDDPCPPGYQLIDGVCQPISDFGGDISENTVGEGFDDSDDRTESEKMFDEMKRSTDNMFGATRFLDKYQIGEDEFGNPIFSFDEKVGRPFGTFGLFDMIFGGAANREEKFNKAIETILGQTSNFGENNPLAFGKQSGDIFTMYNPQQYLDQTKDVVLQQTNKQPVTMGDMIGSLDTGKASQVQSQGTEPVDIRGSSLVIEDDGGVRRRDDTAYQSAVAKNIARNVANTGSTGFSTSLGGFTRGR